ncbi:PH domain-containing protein [Microbacterium gorillae]|uniref:PH domain-containing protein n=1 Tax=Microbacterium gorillae TaxID=1231063 RepID=UPI00058FEF8B|nr:PH domain-containing protein [Microbacterium gorillae]
MTQPTGIGGRPHMPAPGTPAPELLVARLRPHARRLFWSALVLIALAGATGYFYDHLPAPFTNLMLFLAAGLVAVVLVLAPWVIWLSRRYTITTRRVIVADGVFARRRRELSHARGYTVALRRGPLQRLWGTGTLTLSNGVDAPLRMVNIGHARLVHEVLVDQVEVNQILAHRDAYATGVTPPTD